MNITDRYNYQRGNSRANRYNQTIHNIDDSLDIYIVQRQNIKHSHNEQDILNAIDDYVEKQLDTLVKKKLDEIIT